MPPLHNEQHIMLKSEKIFNGLALSKYTIGFGVTCLIGALFLFRSEINVIIPLIILILSLDILFSLKFVEIDYENKRIRTLIIIFPFKKGKWESLSNYNRLILSHEHKSIGTGAAIYYRNDLSFNNYIIYLVNSEEKSKELMLCSFIKIPKAQSTLQKYSKKLNLESTDMIKLSWEKYQRKRSSRASV